MKGQAERAERSGGVDREAQRSQPARRYDIARVAPVVELAANREHPVHPHAPGAEELPAVTGAAQKRIRSEQPHHAALSHAAEAHGRAVVTEHRADVLAAGDTLKDGLRAGKPVAGKHLRPVTRAQMTRNVPDAVESWFSPAHFSASKVSTQIVPTGIVWHD